MHGVLISPTASDVARPQEGGSTLPLCVVAHGFGAVLAIDVFSSLQQGGESGDGELTLLERGQTLAYMGTLGCPHPLVLPDSSESGAAQPARSLVVPTSHMLERWPHLRGGWSNFFHKHDAISLPMRPSNASVSDDVECCRRCADDENVQNVYFEDLTDCIGPVAHSLSCVWQDTNRALALGDTLGIDREPLPE